MLAPALPDLNARAARLKAPLKALKSYFDGTCKLGCDRPLRRSVAAGFPPTAASTLQRPAVRSTENECVPVKAAPVSVFAL